MIEKRKVLKAHIIGFVAEHCRRITTQGLQMSRCTQDYPIIPIIKKPHRIIVLEHFPSQFLMLDQSSTNPCQTHLDMGSIMSSFMPGAGTYTVLGDTDGFFSLYLRQPSDSKASLFKKWANSKLNELNQKFKSSSLSFPPKFSREEDEVLEFEQNVLLPSLTKSVTQSTSRSYLSPSLALICRCMLEH